MQESSYGFAASFKCVCILFTNKCDWSPPDAVRPGSVTCFCCVRKTLRSTLLGGPGKRVLENGYEVLTIDHVYLVRSYTHTPARKAGLFLCRKGKLRHTQMLSDLTQVAEVISDSPACEAGLSYAARGATSPPHAHTQPDPNAHF